MKDFKDVSWIQDINKINLKATQTPNRLDDSVAYRSKIVKPQIEQKEKNPKVNISDSVFNTILSANPGQPLLYNKARLKIFGPRINKVNNIIGKRKGIDHI